VTAWDRNTWQGKKVTVAGLGTFGGQVTAAKFFAGLGAKVTVTDKKKREALEVSLGELDGLDIRYVLGSHDDKDFTQADLVVASPAIPETSEYLQKAEKAGVPITHEMDVFFGLCKAPIVAITGSNGKSTTTALLAHIAGKCHKGGKVWLGGNIGKSLLLDAAVISPRDAVVLELSSFQLEDLGALKVSPHGALVTNLTPNHLDRHVTFEAYADAKRNITRFQSEGDFLVLNADDDNLAGWERTKAKVLYFGKMRAKSRPGVYVSGRSLVFVGEGPDRPMEVPKGWRLRGEHNLMNLAAACAAAGEMGISLADALAAAEDFKSLPHRLEYCATAGGVEFYNDSIATTPESAEVGLDSFTQPIILIAGGYDKGVDLSSFARKAAGRVKALVAIGKTGDAIAAAAKAENAALAILRPATFSEAIMAAYAAAAPGDVVLMSPACASYDMFNNFQERGDIFRRTAIALAGGEKE
jgi:UDP-N-acetylmuramoylalanine--D-glutamate ligase